MPTCQGGIKIACAGVPNGVLVEDKCGNCVSPSDVCRAGCDGVFGSGKTMDACDICGGDGVCRVVVRVDVTLPGGDSVCSIQADIKSAVQTSAGLSSDYVKIVACGVIGDDATLTFELWVQSGDVRRRMQLSNLLVNLQSGVAAGAGVDENTLATGAPEQLAIDCAGVAGGDAGLDACGVCQGTNSSCADCAGIPNGASVADHCSTCDADPHNDCEMDCAGAWGGSSTNDTCGVCNGTQACADCAGVPNGPATEDRCGVCDGDASNDCVADCAGNFGGSAVADACNVCAGDGASCSDCQGNANGNATVDMCGQCDTDPGSDCARDCEGQWGGVSAVDVCGVCDNTTANDGESCAEEVAATPNVDVVLHVSPDADLSAVVAAMATFLGPSIDSSAVVVIGSTLANRSATVAMNLEIASIEGGTERASFEAEFRQDLASRLGISAARISVESVTAGSVTVQFSVAPDALGKPLAQGAIEAAVSNGSSVAGYLVTALTPLPTPAVMVTFQLQAAQLLLAGISISTALDNLQTPVSGGDLPGVIAAQSVSISSTTCPAGYYKADGGACQHCAPGEEPNLSQDDCVGCVTKVVTNAVETWYSSEGAFCELCPIGKMHANDDRKACVQCPSREFNDGNGRNCAPCPANENSESSAGAQCVCDTGYYSSSNLFLECHALGEDVADFDGVYQDGCSKCPEECTTCVGGHAYLREGYALSQVNKQASHKRLSDMRGFVPLFECPFDNACPGQDGSNKSAVSVCELGYDGPLCAACQSEFIRFNGECIDCTGTSLSAGSVIACLMVGIVLVALLVVCAMKDPSEGLTEASEDQVNEQLSSVMTQVKILIGLLQIVCELPETLRLVYPGVFMLILQTLRVVMDPLSKVLELFKIECMTPLSLYLRFWLIMAIPLVCIAFIKLARVFANTRAGRGGASADLVAHRKRKAASDSDYRTFFMFFLL